MACLEFVFRIEKSTHGLNDSIILCSKVYTIRMQRKKRLLIIRRHNVVPCSNLLFREATLGGRRRLTALLLLCQPLLLSGLLSGQSFSTVVLGHGLHNWLLLLGLDDGDGVGERLGWAGLALGVGAAHDLDLDTQDTLAEEDVAGGMVDEVLGGLTGVDHEAVLNTISIPA